MFSRGSSISIDRDTHDLYEPPPTDCPLPWRKNVLNVKLEFPVFRIVLVASCPSTFNMTAVSSPIPLFFPRPKHPRNLYFPCPSFSTALTILGTLRWTHYYASGPLLHCESKSGPCILCAISVVLKIGATQWSIPLNAWSHHKTCLLHEALNQANQTNFGKGLLAW